ncbi:MAG: biotin--[acetyl-CoA-carboxylase] ligase [Natronomonas sp.]
MQSTRRRILDCIADGSASGPEIAAELDISRAAVWKHVEALRREGFEIDGDGGYSLLSVPEFGEGAVAYGLDCPFDVEYHEQIDSTNRRARELAAEGGDDIVVLTDEQTGGRGRLDRDWESPSGGIWLSILCRPRLPPGDVPIYTLAAAVAVAETAIEIGVDASIKWPNDVLVGSEERKLAGILTEMEGEADRISWVIVGIGINANVDAEPLPEAATSLRREVGDVDRGTFTRAVLERFDDLRHDPEAVLPAWRSLSSTLGRRVRIETRREAVTGEAVDVTFPGTLVVDTGEKRRQVSAGDCEHLRPV